MKTFNKLLLFCLLYILAQYAHAQDNAPLYMLLEDIPGQPARLYKFPAPRPTPLNEPGPFGDSLKILYGFTFQIKNYHGKTSLTGHDVTFDTAFDARLRGKKPNMHREVPLSELDNLPVMSPAELAQLILSDYNGDEILQDHMCSFFLKCQENNRPLFVVEKLQDKAVIYRVEFISVFCIKL